MADLIASGHNSGDAEPGDNGEELTSLNEDESAATLLLQAEELLASGYHRDARRILRRFEELSSGDDEEEVDEILHRMRAQLASDRVAVSTALVVILMLPLLWWFGSH